MLIEDKDICPECKNTKCFCFEFGVSDTQGGTRAAADKDACPACLGGLSIAFGILPRCPACGSTGKLPPADSVRPVQDRVRDTPGTSLDLFSRN
jgi:hypothetical protein